MTVSYWQDEETIKVWKAHAEHPTAQQLDRQKWHPHDMIRIAKVDQEYRFGKDS